MFYSDWRVPHAVLPTKKMRFSCTYWMMKDIGWAKEHNSRPPGAIEPSADDDASKSSIESSVSVTVEAEKQVEAARKKADEVSKKRLEEEKATVKEAQAGKVMESIVEEEEDEGFTKIEEVEPVSDPSTTSAMSTELEFEVTENKKGDCVVSIKLPAHVTSAAEMELDVSESAVVCKTTTEPVCSCNVSLPFKVDANRGKAKMAKDKTALNVILPVLN